MDKLLAQFIEEGRDLITSAGQGLLRLERQPGDTDLLDTLFRDVHTLKGSAGVLELNPMVQVVHIAEEILELAKDEPDVLDADAIDQLLEAMDLLNSWMDSLDTAEALPGDADTAAGQCEAALASIRARFNESGGAFSGGDEPEPESGEGVSWGLFDGPVPAESAPGGGTEPVVEPPEWLSRLDENVRAEAWDRLKAVDVPLQVVAFTPEEDCFFRGDDPLFLARQTPGLMAMDIALAETDEPPETQDVYRSRLRAGLLVVAADEALHEHFQYEDATVEWHALTPEHLVQPTGEPGGVTLDEDFLGDLDQLWSERRWQDIADRLSAQLQLINQGSREASLLRWLQRVARDEPDDALVFDTLLQALRDPENTQTGDGEIPWYTLLPVGKGTRPEAEETPDSTGHGEPDTESTVDDVGNHDLPIIQNLAPDARSIAEDQLKALNLCNEQSMRDGILASVRLVLSRLADSLNGRLPDPVREAETGADLANALQAWLDDAVSDGGNARARDSGPASKPQATSGNNGSEPKTVATGESSKPQPKKDTQKPPGPGGEPAAPVIRNFKVDQEQVEQLGDLVGELVVAKNALPFLAQRAEQVYQQRQLAREIREQFNVINRITSALQDAMMAVQMLPVSYVFDRFPRLVRDLSRKLDKSIDLTIRGEDTEAEKHVIESLADPLVHMMRNSIDHGIESRDKRAANGKPETGQISLSAWQQEEWVVIEVADDGGGIDPEKTKMKAYEKGLVDERRLREMSEKEAIELIFAPGFSTTDEASDLSGRGVGMDVVRTTIEKAGGRIDVHSELGNGTRFRLYLPLSMSISRVMQIWIDGQRYGIPMDQVAETVRLPSDRVHQFKGRETVLLRDRVLPVCRARAQLGLESQRDGGSIALLVVRHRDDLVALAVDDFSEGVEVILKPMEGALSALGIYQGTALLGDGSVLLVLNPGVLLSTATLEEVANDHTGKG